MAFVRVRYRPKPVHPELNEAKENTALSLAKKEKPIEVDPYSDIKKITSEEPVFLPTHTQNRRVEVIIESNEEAYRREHYPTVYDRIETQKEWVIRQLQDAKFATKREALIRKTDKAMNLAKRMTTSLEDNEEGNFTGEIPPEYDEDLEQDLDDLQEEDDKMEEMQGEETKTLKENQRNLKEQFLAIKEKKLVMSRNTHTFHQELKKSAQRNLFLKAFFGFTINKKNSKAVTYITDWLLVGRKDVALNLQSLLQMSITHILNVTPDVKNAFGKHFIYEKIAVRDVEEEDIARHFTKMIAFIKRCEDCQGRIFVHCLAGSSRAPTAVIAFLIVEKKLPLIDAYNYVTMLRQFVRPNNRFLFQLAMLEVQMGEGCSVYYHREWRFYEFNLFRAEGVPERPSIGLRNTIARLYEKKKDDIV